MLGTLLTFAVAMLTVAARFSLSPAQTGVALSYILLVQQVSFIAVEELSAFVDALQSFGWMIRQSAEVENDMNGVERIVHYANEVEQEPPHEVPANKPPSTWPAEGQVELNNVFLKYRPELPDVLKGITMTVKGGEKIGIVGRYAFEVTPVRFLLSCIQYWRWEVIYHGCLVPTRRAVARLDCYRRS